MPDCQRITCECGASMLKGALKRHLQGHIHQLNLNPRPKTCICGVDISNMYPSNYERHLVSLHHLNYDKPKPTTCECGHDISKLSPSLIKRHRRSRLHQKTMDTLATMTN
jgi:hypothetical protein